MWRCIAATRRRGTYSEISARGGRGIYCENVKIVFEVRLAKWREVPYLHVGTLTCLH